MEETAKKNDISRTIVARYGSIGRRDKNIEINIITAEKRLISGHGHQMEFMRKRDLLLAKRVF